MEVTVCDVSDPKLAFHGLSCTSWLDCPVLHGWTVLYFMVGLSCTSWLDCPVLHGWIDSAAGRSSTWQTTDQTMHFGSYTRDRATINNSLCLSHSHTHIHTYVHIHTLFTDLLRHTTAAYSHPCNPSRELAGDLAGTMWNCTMQTEMMELG
ncbi:hypothetical protein BsWGS_07018 [Bradybaena similaris]